MCGIFGEVTRKDAALDGAPLKRALDALQHRGPDDEGVWVGEGGRVCLAQKRLSIRDLSDAGHQPMVSACGRYILVYNGELYGVEALRDELIAEGIAFRSTSDTEVLLEAWSRWGASILERLNGMFAFAIWDRRDTALHLVRDRLGIKPLYMVETSGRLTFASELRALMASGRAPRRICPEALDSFLRFGSVTEPRTILRGVMALPPGTHRVWRDGIISDATWWTLPWVANPTKESSDAAIAALPGLLQDAVTARLVADVPVGIFLSGGIDSSAIVSLASRSGTSGSGGQGALHTFTATFDDSALSEAKFAREVAEKFGTQHTEVYLPAEQIPTEIHAAIAAYDQPGFDGVNTWFVARAAREAGLVVALSGLGGDEVFAGYPGFSRLGRAMKMASLVPGPLARLGRAGLNRIPTGILPNRLQKGADLGLSGGSAESAYAALRSMFPEDRVARLIAPGLRAEARNASPFGGVHLPEGADIALSDDPARLYGLLDQTHYMRDTLLRATDAMAMAHHLEVRVPLLDHRVLACASQISMAHLMNRRTDGGDLAPNKPVLCAAIGDLPRAATHRPKMGFTLPYDRWFRTTLRDFVEGHLTGEGARRRGIIDPKEGMRLWSGFLRGERTVSHARVWTLALLDAWAERHDITA